MATDLRGKVPNAVGRVLAEPQLRTLYGVYFLTFVVSEVYRQAVPLYFDALGISAVALGAAWAIVNAAETVASPVAGVLADDFDRFALGSVAALATVLLLVVFAFAPGAAVLVALMVGIGLAQLQLGNAATPAVSEGIESGGDGLGWALRDVSIYLGGAVGLMLGSLIVIRLDGVAAVFPALAPVALLMAILLWRVAEPSLPSTRTDRPALREVVPTPTGLARSLRGLTEPGLLLHISTTKGLASLGMGMGTAFLPLLALDVGVPAEWYLFAFAVSNVAAIPLSVLGGLAADRYSRKWLFVGNFTVEALMLGAFALTENRIFFVGGLALYVAQTTFEPAVIAYFFDQFDDAESGRAWGLSGAISKAAGVGGPALGGALYVLDPNLGFAVGAVLTGAGALIAVTLPE